jgi:hypothetical protein
MNETTVRQQRSMAPKPIRLSRRHFAGGRCALGPDHISNGHWAIRREAVANAEDFATPAQAAVFLGPEIYVEAIPVLFAKLIFKAAAGRRATRWTVAGKATREVCPAIEALPYQSTESDQGIAFLGRVLVNHLKLTGKPLWSSSRLGVFRDAETALASRCVLMSMRHNPPFDGGDDEEWPDGVIVR